MTIVTISMLWTTCRCSWWFVTLFHPRPTLHVDPSLLRWFAWLSLRSQLSLNQHAGLHENLSHLTFSPDGFLATSQYEPGATVWNVGVATG